MIGLIVNADDFGWSPSINSGILECHRRGIVTSATLMANMPGFEDAVAGARATPTLAVGVHLNLLRGRSILPAREIPSLVDAAGHFRRTARQLFADFLLRRVDPREIEVELEAQIRRVREAGIEPTHCDSEKHLHGLPGLSRLFESVLLRSGIAAKRRLTWEPPRVRDLGRSGFYKMAALRLGRTFETPRTLGRNLDAPEALRTPDRSRGVSQVRYWNREELLRVIDALALGVTELIVHPGYVDDECRRVTSEHAPGSFIDRYREAEASVLTDDRVRAAIDRRRIAMLTFRDLGTAA